MSSHVVELEDVCFGALRHGNLEPLPTHSEGKACLAASDCAVDKHSRGVLALPLLGPLTYCVEGAPADDVGCQEGVERPVAHSPACLVELCELLSLRLFVLEARGVAGCIAVFAEAETISSSVAISCIALPIGRRPRGARREAREC